MTNYGNSCGREDWKNGAYLTPKVKIATVGWGKRGYCGGRRSRDHYAMGRLNTADWALILALIHFQNVCKKPGVKNRESALLPG